MVGAWIPDRRSFQLFMYISRAAPTSSKRSFGPSTNGLAQTLVSIQRTMSLQLRQRYVPCLWKIITMGANFADTVLIPFPLYNFRALLGNRAKMRSAIRKRKTL